MLVSGDYVVVEKPTDRLADYPEGHLVLNAVCEIYDFEGETRERRTDFLQNGYSLGRVWCIYCIIRGYYLTEWTGD